MLQFYIVCTTLKKYSDNPIVHFTNAETEEIKISYSDIQAYYTYT
jgi:hypothetical protein